MSARAPQRLRATAVDGALVPNRGFSSTVPPFLLKAYQNGARAIRQTGTWSTRKATSHCGGTVRVATKRGATQK